MDPSARGRKCRNFARSTQSSSSLDDRVPTTTSLPKGTQDLERVDGNVDSAFAQPNWDPLTLQIVDMASPAAARAQLSSHFIQRYIPYDLPHQPVFASIYSKWFESHGASGMSSAAESLLLLQLAATTNNLRLQMEGERLYYVAVHQLRTALAHPSGVLHDSVLGTTSLLGTCYEFHNKLGSGAHCHINGLMAIFRARGPAALRSAFARNVMRDFIPLAFLQATYERKALFVGRRDWLDALEPHCQSAASNLALCTLPIPGILEKADVLLCQSPSSPVDRGALFDVLNELVRVQASMKNWLLWWYTSKPSAEPQLSVSLQKDFNPIFTSSMHPGLPAYPFHSASKFTGIEEALVHFWYWVILLTVQTAVLTVATLEPDESLILPNMAPSRQRRRLIDDCEETADAICQTVPWLVSQPINVASAISTGLVHANGWFERHGSRTKIAWCSAWQNAAQDATLNHQFYNGSSSVDRVFGGWLMLAPT